MLIFSVCTGVVAGTLVEHEPFPLPTVFAHEMDEAGHWTAPAEHVVPVGEPQEPELHVTVAEPVPGAVLSVSDLDEPGDVALALAVHVLPPTVHENDCAGQFGGGDVAQLVLVGVPHVPEELQVTVAEPVCGAVLSTSEAEDPGEVATALAEHVLPLTVQEKDCAGQLGTVQLVLVGAPQTPSMQG